jgi:hypothetical protein
MPFLNFGYSMRINTAPGGGEAVWAEVSEGFDKIGKTVRESVFQGAFVGDGGFASTEVTGGQLIVTLSGVRVYGDPAQDYIFSDAVKNGRAGARKTDFSLVEPDGATIAGKVTLARIEERGGNANEPCAVSVEIHFNGRPEFHGRPVLETAGQNEKEAF